MIPILAAYISSDTLLTLSIGAMVASSVALVGLFNFIRSDNRDFQARVENRIAAIEQRLEVAASPRTREETTIAALQATKAFQEANKEGTD